MLSEKFWEALKEKGIPYHQIAWEAGLSPNQLYKITAGIDRPHPGDPRIEAVAKVIGISMLECFKKEPENQYLQKTALLDRAVANGEAPKVIAQFRLRHAETGVRQILEKIRDHLASQIGERYDSNLSRRLDLVQAVIDNLKR